MHQTLAIKQAWKGKKFDSLGSCTRFPCMPCQDAMPAFVCKSSSRTSCTFWAHHCLQHGSKSLDVFGARVLALLLVLGFHGTISHLWFLLFIKANLFLHFQRTIMVKCGLDSLTFSLFLCFGGVVWLMDLKNRFLNVRLAPYNGKLGLGSCLVKEKGLLAS